MTSALESHLTRFSHLGSDMLVHARRALPVRQRILGRHHSTVSSSSALPGTINGSAAPAARAREDHLPRLPNLAAVRARRTGPRPPATGAPGHRAGSPAARARLNLTGPNSGFPKAPRGGAPSPCLREPPGTLRERPRDVPDARRRLENAPPGTEPPPPRVIITPPAHDYPPMQDPGSSTGNPIGPGPQSGGLRRFEIF